MTPSGIETATFWFVAQCLNQLRHKQRAAVIQYTNTNFPSNMILFVADINTDCVWNLKIINMWAHKFIIFSLYTYLCFRYVILCMIMVKE